MRTMTWFVALSTMGIFGCAQPESGGEKAEAATEAGAGDDTAAVRVVAESFDPAVNAKDTDAVLELYASDAVRLGAGGPAIVGAEALRASFAADFEVDFKESNPVAEVQVAGDWAFADGTYEYEVEDSSETGKWVSIFRKTPDGWKYAVDIWNRDAPSTSSAPASASESPALPEPSVPEELATLLDSWNAALAAGDIDALMEQYRADSRRMNADEPIVSGLDAIRANFETELATPPDTSEATVHGLGVEGDWAYVWGTWAETRGRETDRGKWLEIFRHDSDGWKIHLEIWNRGV